MQTRKTLWSVLAAAGVLMATPLPSAQAQDEQKLAVAPFQGESRSAQRLADQARAASVSAITEWFTLIPDEDYEQAVTAVGEGGPDDERFARIAATVGAQGILFGVIDEADDRAVTLALSVRSARDGQILESVSLELPRRRVDKDMRDALGAEVPKLVMKFFATEKARVEKAAADEKARAEAEVLAKKEAEEKARKEAEDKARQEAEDKAREEAERKREEKLRLRGSGGVGLSFMGRNLAFTTEDNPAAEPYSYDGALASGLMLSGEVFPLGATGIEPLANLGFTVLFDRTLLLKTEFQGEDYSTAETRWGVGLRYLFPLGESVDKAPSIQASLGLNGMSHTIDTGNMVFVPDVSYTFLDIGVGMRMPINEQLKVKALARYLLVLSSGAISEPENYGGTSVLGLDFDAGVEYLVTPVIKVSAGVQFTHMSLTFDGDGMLAMDATGNQFVNGGSDTFLGGYLAAGYDF